MNYKRLLTGNIWTRAPRYMLMGILVLVGLRQFLIVMAYILTPIVYQDDLVQDYAMAKAIAEGISPATPSPELWARYGIPNGHPESAFGSPHPLTLGVLMLPLTALDFPRAAMAWLVVSIVCLLVSIHLLERIARVELQTNLQILVLLCGMWLAFRNGRPSLAGCLLGLTFLIKQLLWPLLFVLAIRRQWRALAFSLLTASSGYLLTLAIVGISPFLAYFSQSLPRNTEFYGGVLYNMSLWSVGWRVFDGTADWRGNPFVPPLVPLPEAAPIVSLAVPLLALSVSLYAARRARRLETALGAMICMSLLLSPIAWTHYLTVLALPAVHVWVELAKRRFPPAQTALASLAVILVFVPWEEIALDLTLASGWMRPYVALGLGLAPMFAAMLMVWLVLSLDSVGLRSRQNRPVTI